MPLEVSGSYPKTDVVVETLDLKAAARMDSDLRNEPQGVEERRKFDAEVLKRARKIARYVLRTLNNFLASDAPTVSVEHVFLKAIADRKDGKGNTDAFFTEKASIAYDRMNNAADQLWPQTHDGYMKRFQLSKGSSDLGPQSRPRCCTSDMLSLIHI